MKKLLFALLAAAAVTATIFTVSCLDEDYNQDKPEPFTDEQFARNLYIRTNVQNAYLSLDPARVAFAFNMLWATSNKASVLDEVKYTASSGSSIERRNLKYDLFGGQENKLEYDATTGTWTLSFSAGTYGDKFYGRNRDGKIIIKTNRKYLEELEEGESWEISFWSEATVYEDEGEFYRQVSTEPMSDGSLAPDTHLKFSDYKITRASSLDNEWAWSITGTSYADAGSKYNEKHGTGYTSADWKFNYTLIWKPDPIKKLRNQTYEGVMTGLYYLGGSAKGRIYNVDTTFDSWRANSPILIKPMCDPDGRYSNGETMILNLKEYADGNNNVTTEDVTVRVKFEDSGSCVNHTTLIYKNNSYSY